MAVWFIVTAVGVGRGAGSVTIWEGTLTGITAKLKVVRKDHTRVWSEFMGEQLGEEQCQVPGCRIFGDGGVWGRRE